MLVRHAVIVLILCKKDVVVFGHFQLAVVFNLISLLRQGIKQVFLICHKTLLTAVRLLLHTGLVVQSYHLCNSFVERAKAKKLPLTKAGINAIVNQFYLVLYKCFVFGFARSGRDYRTLVVVGKVFKCPVYIGFVMTGLYDG